MTENCPRNEMLAGRQGEVLPSGKWIANTNFKELIISISREQTIQKVHGLNSISALTFHINNYLQGILNVFNRGTLEIYDKFSCHLPENLTERDWKEPVNVF